MQKRGSHHKGVVSIEFSMGFFFFMALFFVWAQIAYMGYVSGVIDYAVAETARNTRASIPTHKSEDDTSATLSYQAQFRYFLIKQAGVWGKLVDPDKFSIRTYYYESIQSLASNCNTEDEDNTTTDCLSQGAVSEENDAPVAVYQVSYHFSPLFNLFNAQEISLKREVFVVQEYERNKFYN
ncbi:TadE/TadG family type IV pilus assembly protein [Celerinatantimonas sp. YJH-8]